MQRAGSEELGLPEEAGLDPEGAVHHPQPELPEPVMRRGSLTAVNDGGWGNGTDEHLPTLRPTRPKSPNTLNPRHPPPGAPRTWGWERWDP